MRAVIRALSISGLTEFEGERSVSMDWSSSGVSMDVGSSLQNPKEVMSEDCRRAFKSGVLESSKGMGGEGEGETRDGSVVSAYVRVLELGVRRMRREMSRIEQIQKRVFLS